MNIAERDRLDNGVVLRVDSPKECFALVAGINELEIGETAEDLKRFKQLAAFARRLLEQANKGKFPKKHTVSHGRLAKIAVGLETAFSETEESAQMAAVTVVAGSPTYNEVGVSVKTTICDYAQKLPQQRSQASAQQTIAEQHLEAVSAAGAL